MAPLLDPEAFADEVEVLVLDPVAVPVESAEVTVEVVPVEVFDVKEEAVDAVEVADPVADGTETVSVLVVAEEAEIAVEREVEVKLEVGVEAAPVNPARVLLADGAVPVMENWLDCARIWFVVSTATKLIW